MSILKDTENMKALIEAASKILTESVQPEEIEEGNSENKLKKNIFVAKIGHDKSLHGLLDRDAKTKPKGRGIDSNFFSKLKADQSGHSEKYQKLKDIKHFKKEGRRALKSEEVEQIDEISKKTLSSYVKKAKASANAHDHMENMHRAVAKDREDEHNEQALKHMWKAENRRQNVEKAEKKLAKEDVEQIDEISMKLADSYLKKAVDKDSNLKPERVAGSTLIAQKENKRKGSPSPARVSLTYSKGILKNEETSPRKLKDILEDLKRGRGRPKKKRNLAGEIVDDDDPNS